MLKYYSIKWTAYRLRRLIMAVKINTSIGTIEITNDVIATVVGGAATDVFGIVGMASKNQLKDNINEILRKENYARGIVVRQEETELP